MGRLYFSGLKTSKSGFSIAEILICLVLVGVLSAMTVPMLLKGTQTDQASKYNSMAKNVAFMITTAYERYKIANGSVPSTLKADDLMAYMNYVSKLPTTQQLDVHATAATYSSCAGGTAGNQPGNCYKLHNGAALWADTASYFGGTTTSNAIYFRFDPNATYDGAVSDAPGMGMQLALYYDGYIKTRATLRPSTAYYNITSGALKYESSAGTEDPSWFQGF
jgi:prepilin-type N-terminal cleavage/methylation domain-containing protein